MMSALKAADPVRDRVVPYDEVLLSEILAGPRPLPAERRRRLVVVGWVLALLIPVAGGTAALAGGGAESEIKSAFFWNGDEKPSQRLDLRTAVLVSTQPGPGGTNYDVWVATGPHRRCVAMLFELPGAVPPPLQDGSRGQLGGECTSWPDGAEPWTSDGGENYGRLKDLVFFALDAGTAVRVELHLPNGSVRPVSVQHGWAAGLVKPADLGDHGTLYGYAADGSVVGSRDLYPLDVPATVRAVTPTPSAPVASEPTFG